MLTPAAALPALMPAERAALDDDAALAGHTEWVDRADGTREARSVFAVQGMDCAACAGHKPGPVTTMSAASTP